MPKGRVHLSRPSSSAPTQRGPTRRISESPTGREAGASKVAISLRRDERKTCAGTQHFRATRTSGSTKRYRGLMSPGHRRMACARMQTVWSSCTMECAGHAAPLLFRSPFGRPEAGYFHSVGSRRERATMLRVNRITPPPAPPAARGARRRSECGWFASPFLRFRSRAARCLG
jgi:hypothetical protein